jgi:UDP-N-acetylmuramate dehydrogenase
MIVKENVSLRKYNTFGIDIRARYLAAVQQESEISGLLHQHQPLLILGGGSNILFSGDFPGLVIKNDIRGREIIRQDQEYAWVRLGAGENWHQCVLWAIQNDWAGIENLSLIPGTVGAAPMQNIGAYGVELCSVFESLEGTEISTGKTRVFKTPECDFGYRYSVFKGPLRDRYIITRVVLKLPKNPVFNVSYGAVSQTLEEMGIEHLTIKDVSDAVIKIRQSKLPDPEKIGNAGSFFKNPSVQPEIFNTLKTEYANIPNSY